MPKRCSSTTRKLTVAVGLVLVFGLAMAWANHYSASKVIKKRGKGQFFIVNNGPNKIQVAIQKGALDSYLQEQGQSTVNITAELDETWIDLDNGDGYYRLDFTFGPSGAYFDPPLELEFQGAYFTEVSDVTLYDEDGEQLPSDPHPGGNKMTYYIPHFSSYSYDHYDY